MSGGGVSGPPLTGGPRNPPAQWEEEEDLYFEMEFPVIDRSRQAGVLKILCVQEVVTHFM